MSKRFGVACAWVAAAFFAVTGAWAFLAPHSFYQSVATWPPYNPHLFHDAGSFQLGIAAAVLAGLAGRSALATGLWAATVASALHAVAHWIDADLGGRSSDPILLTVLAALLAAGLIATEAGREPTR